MSGLKLALAKLRDGQRIDYAADEAERAAVAERLNLLGLERLEAALTLRCEGEKVRAEGRLRASVTQACVASGEPVSAIVDEKIALLFMPEPAGTPDEELELSAEDLDVIFHDGREIDLGTAVADELSLALDPYPRSAGAEDALKEAGVLSEEQAGPFAALAALKGK
ncbi:YceD family protein [Sphingomonas sp. LHG3443-2]|uniref:YceD family protein n=1 Tax=Sphingomonas sp. LHG3443-2 TaxID=2804639 RepID=UPI003CF14E62